jgi:hypothetical protein
VKVLPVLHRLARADWITNKQYAPLLAEPPVMAVISVGEIPATLDAGIAVGPAPCP